MILITGPQNIFRAVEWHRPETCQADQPPERAQKMEAESLAEPVLMAERLGINRSGDLSSAKGRLNPV